MTLYSYEEMANTPQSRGYTSSFSQPQSTTRSPPLDYTPLTPEYSLSFRSNSAHVGALRWSPLDKANLYDFLSEILCASSDPPKVIDKFEIWIDDGYGPLCMLTVHLGFSDSVYDVVSQAESDMKDILASLRGINVMQSLVVPKVSLTRKMDYLIKSCIAFEHLPMYVKDILHLLNVR